MNIDELRNSKDMFNVVDVIFQKLPSNIYIEVKNRKRPVSNSVYEWFEIKKFNSYEVIETTYVVR